MKICTADMPSYTYAVKGEKLLKARGFPCEVKRKSASGGGGCGFTLVIRGSCREALKVLDRYSVPYTLQGGGG